MSSTKELINEISQRLKIDEDIKNFEARVIASQILGIEFSELATSHGGDLSDKQSIALDKIISERNNGIPLAYVLKSAPFRELDLYVDSRVLIPRPETELLVELVLKEISEIENPVVLDIGTGSGAIALSIAHENKKAKAIGVDISDEALEVARLNMAAVGSSASRVNFQQSDLFSTLDENIKYDVIVSNPPYGSENEKVHQSVIDHEPKIAVFADNNGLALIEKIIRNAQKYLKPKGDLFLEIGETQAERILKFCSDEYNAEILKDFTGRDRFAHLSPRF